MALVGPVRQVDTVPTQAVNIDHTPQPRATALTGAAPASTGGVVLWFDPSTGKAFLAMVGLDASRTFELVARDAAQGSEASLVASGVKAHGPLSGMLLERVTDLMGRVIELRDPNTGTVLYRGQLR